MSIDYAGQVAPGEGRGEVGGSSSARRGRARLAANQVAGVLQRAKPKLASTMDGGSSSARPARHAGQPPDKPSTHQNRARARKSPRLAPWHLPRAARPLAGPFWLFCTASNQHCPLAKFTFNFESLYFLPLQYAGRIECGAHTRPAERAPGLPGGRDLSGS